jgi:hypothetical protein
MSAAMPPAPDTAAAAPYDPERLQGLTATCEGYEREVVLELLLRVPWLVQEIGRAVVLRDPDRLTLHAGELRRCCDSLGARPLADVSESLEHMGERGDCREARVHLDQAQRELKRLEHALADHLAGLRQG